MQQRSLFQKTLVLAIVCALLLAGVYLVIKASREPLRHLAEIAIRIETVAKAFNLVPHITVDRETLLTGATPAFELVAHKQQFEHTMTWTSTWMGSTNEIALRGTLTASAGFDLTEPLNIEFDTSSRKVVIRHPRPKILSVQVESINTMEDQGWWNRITNENRSSVLSQFTKEARVMIETEGEILENTRRDLREQLRNALEGYWPAVEFIEERPPLIQNPL